MPKGHASLERRLVIEGKNRNAMSLHRASELEAEHLQRLAAGQQREADRRILKGLSKPIGEVVDYFW